MKRVLWFVGVPLAVLVTGVAGFAPVYVMGLVVPMFIVGPLALLAGSLLAALSAGWIANFSAHDTSVQTRSRLWAIFAVALAASLVGLLAATVGAFFINELWVGMGFGASLAVYYLPGAVIFSGATTVAAWRLRSPAADRLDFMGRMALVLAAVWMGSLILVESLLTGVLPYSSLQDLAGLLSILELVVLFEGGLVLAALGIFLATRFSRRTREHSLRWDAVLSLVSVGLLPFAVAGAIFLACSFSYCGA